MWNGAWTSGRLSITFRLVLELCLGRFSLMLNVVVEWRACVCGVVSTRIRTNRHFWKCFQSCRASLCHRLCIAPRQTDYCRALNSVCLWIVLNPRRFQSRIIVFNSIFCCLQPSSVAFILSTMALWLCCCGLAITGIRIIILWNA